MRTPLDGWPDVAVANWPAARQAGELLALLGAHTTTVADPSTALRCEGVEVRGAATSAEQDWSESGAMALTGLGNGVPLHSSGRPATLARAAALALELLTARAGTIPVRVDGAALLGQRAALLGMQRQGTTSVGGGSHLLPAADGWFALALPRPDDVDLVPALTGSADPGDPWDLVGRWAGTRPVGQVVARASTLLGLAAGELRYPLDAPRPWSVRRLDGPRMPRPVDGPPLVVNLGSLWAAPLCAHLLSRSGARVIDIESPNRPDGARLGTPSFHRTLHHGHTLEILELSSPDGRAELHELVARADVVVTGSRRRGLMSLGLTPNHHDAARARTWIEITGHGSDSPRIGYGDDAAVAGGLVAWSDTGPVFAGDAIADPLTGLLGAVAAAGALAAGGSWHIQLALRDVAAYSLRHGSSSSAL